MGPRVVGGVPPRTICTSNLCGRATHRAKRCQGRRVSENRYRGWIGSRKERVGAVEGCGQRSDRTFEVGCPGKEATTVGEMRLR